MRNGVMEDAQVSYNHEEDIKGQHVSMGNAKTKSNGRRDRKEHVTMRSVHREVQRYRDDNENIKKAQEEILQRLNMLHKKVNKYFGTNKETSVIKVSTSRSHRKMDDHGNDRHPRRMSRHHHSQRHFTSRTHAISIPGSIPSVSLIQRQRRSPEVDIFQGELRKINPTTFNGEHQKGEEAEE
jgi:hypothetical protein